MKPLFSILSGTIRAAFCMTAFIILQISEIARRGQLCFTKIHFGICSHSRRKRLSHSYGCPCVADNHVYFCPAGKLLSVTFLPVLWYFAGILVENLILLRSWRRQCPRREVISRKAGGRRSVRPLNHSVLSLRLFSCPLPAPRRPLLPAQSRYPPPDRRHCRRS